jgi:nitrate reductase gamma subunit
MSNLNFLLFGIYPYIAVAILFIGSWIRYDREPYSWKADSSQLLDQKGFRLASNLFHIGIIFVLCGHFVGLLTPHAIYGHFITSEAKQLVAMVSGGFFGFLCLIGLVMLINRRLNNARVRASSKTSDIVILFMLLIQLVLGLFTIVASTHHLDGSVMIMLADWAQHIVILQPVEAVKSIAPVSLVYKLHVFFGLTLLVVFPFTRLVHIISVPVKYFARNYQLVRER